MSDKSKKGEERLSKTGAVPRIEFENRERRHVSHVPNPPETLPEFPEDGASTGLVHVVSEDTDQSAKGDDDSPTGQ